MFQTFDATTRPADGPPRLAALRAAMGAEGLDGWIAPRADAHQGEYVAPCDDRLAWLTGFTGSAGFCAVLATEAGVFIDGRYRVQVKAQVDLGAFTPVHWPETKLGPWLKDRLPDGARVGFDPWLHTADEIARLREAAPGLVLVPGANLIDRIWTDRPAPPAGPVVAHPLDLAGEAAADKRARVARTLAEAGQRAAVLTLPDGIAWLLNIRGADLPKVPVALAFAVLHDDGRVDLFLDPARVAGLRDHLGPQVAVHPPGALAGALAGLTGPVRVDRGTAPLAVSQALEAAGVAVAWGADPCLLPKARKNAAEIAGTRAAHLRDAAAMVEFLCWLDREAPGGGLTEIGVVTALEGFRRATNALLDISFDTISGAGAHGAIVHYRVTQETDRPVRPGELLLVDSGGQYLDGTTDITRTVAVGDPRPDQRAAFTRVLRGVIALSRLRFPPGVAGGHIDTLARVALWSVGMDYDHGTGHGVGTYLSVHEGPQRISRISDVALEAGMILSNEPGHYREGDYGIRIENLIVVTEAAEVPGGDPGRRFHGFETLTWVPVDRRLIDVDLMPPEDRAWLDAYHAQVLDMVGPRVSAAARAWLEAACAPL
ncbi:MAG: aminopeptidase P family protein [Rhodobacteraceae bacterium]|jgi:Xaa-Pro aminopeptidase|nr:aminopeptidase P family protein [Paracoccaceae bacterium]